MTEKLTVTDDFDSEITLVRGAQTIESVSMVSTAIYSEKEPMHLSSEVKWFVFIVRISSITRLFYKTKKSAKATYDKLVKATQS